MADTREESASRGRGHCGLYSTDNLQIGDTLYTGNAGLQFKPLPQFTQELFMRVTPKERHEAEVSHKGIDS